jgi:hypothetical protein
MSLRRFSPAAAGRTGSGITVFGTAPGEPRFGPRLMASRDLAGRVGARTGRHPAAPFTAPFSAPWPDDLQDRGQGQRSMGGEIEVAKDFQVQ